MHGRMHASTHESKQICTHANECTHDRFWSDETMFSSWFCSPFKIAFSFKIRITRRNKNVLDASIGPSVRPSVRKNYLLRWGFYRLVNPSGQVLLCRFKRTHPRKHGGVKSKTIKIIFITNYGNQRIFSTHFALMNSLFLLPPENLSRRFLFRSKIESEAENKISLGGEKNDAKTAFM